MFSLVEEEVTQTQEKLLSSEMNLLNNLCLMGLSTVFCFSAYLYFSVSSPQLRYCVLLFFLLVSLFCLGIHMALRNHIKILKHRYLRCFSVFHHVIACAFVHFFIYPVQTY